MMNSSILGNDDLATLFAGVLGYLAGKEKNSGFEPFIKQYTQRLEQLKFFKIYPSMGFFNKNPNFGMIFREAIQCYLYGLPNSCIPSLIRVLEGALRQKYEILEKKTPQLDLFGLINWAESRLDINSTLAHSYRMMRNQIHSDKLVLAQDCLEAIRHVTNIISDIFPEFGEFPVFCPYCHMPKNPNFGFVDGVKFIGNVLEVPCSCGRKYQWIVFP